MPADPRWLERYLAGEHETVWDELRRLGPRVREPGLEAQARAVSDETARRVRRNLERVVARLTAQGYRFHENDDAQTPTVPLSGPAPGAQDLLDWLERTVGPVPLVVSSWVRIVGDVWLVGTHPAWRSSAAADPLVVEIAGSRFPGADVREHFVDELDGWREDPQGRPFRLPVSPDHLHKDNVSGGPPYGVVLPDAGADALFVTDAAGDAAEPFVGYVRRVLRRGGFPRPTGDPGQDAVTGPLAAGLDPV